MKNITPKEAQKIIENTPDAILVDVRTDEEVAEISIPKALHIPLEELSLRLYELPIDATVIFYCRSGARSEHAAIFAESVGYENSHNVLGGIMEWAASGLPVTRDASVSRGFAQQGTIALAVVASIILAGFILFLNKEPRVVMPNSQIVAKKAATLVNLTSKELATMLEKKDFFFANVHIPYEGELKNTDAFIPFDKVSSSLDKLPEDKNAKIVLYCRSDRMSKIAGNELLRLGYTNVSHLSGGMVSWTGSGYEIILK